MARGKRTMEGGVMGSTAGKYAALSVGLLVMLSAVVIGGQQIGEEAQVSPAPAANYVPHAPIRINSNAEFASKAASEGWSGDGTTNNPYIIENYEISAVASDGIYIWNTNVYFIIRNSLIKDGSDLYTGILLRNASHGTIDNCTSFNNDIGIFLYTHCDYCTLTNNNASNNHMNGIYLWDCNNSIITNNI
ncbi:MAG: right-handed parallel beta-helix repeat-containing protein, partial [Candidatus Thermoplasmatota archaeon]